jgi:threonine dehydrogenase-like Zn-dependent dehydrogenase
VHVHQRRDRDRELQRKDPNVFRPGSWCAYPWKSGYSNVGVVRAVGASVVRAKPGDRVFTWGPHASAIRYDEGSLVFPVPQNLDPMLAAAARMAGVSTTALIVSRHEGNPWVVVFGLGMVGNLAAQAFRIKGCRVIGVDPVASRRQLALQCGIPHAIGGKPDEVHAQIKELTGGRLADIAVESVGLSSVVLQALKATAGLGQLVLLGSPRGACPGDLTEMLWDIHIRNLTVRGALEWRLPTYSETPSIVSHYSKEAMICDWLHRGELKLAPLISHRLRPTQIREAYEGLAHQPDTYTGVGLVWR